jgi:hypothetical protein
MNTEKKIGYGLLIGGIVVMCIAAIEIVLLTVGLTKPFPYFDINQATAQQKTAAPTPASNSQTDILTQLQKSIPGLDQGSLSGLTPKIDILPTQAINDLLNTITHFVVMGFLLNFGQKLALIGVNLVRPIYVNLKAKDYEVVNKEV